MLQAMAAAIKTGCPDAYRGTVGVTIPSEVSQSVRDRGIAHVQSGGIAGA